MTIRRLDGPGMSDSSVRDGVTEIVAGSELHANSNDVDAVSAVAQACLQAYGAVAASGFRCWGGLLQICGTFQLNHGSALLDGIARRELSEEARHRLAEDMRVHFRDIAELSLQEARLLQAALENLGESLARSTAGTVATLPYRRRWRAKP